MCCHFSDRKIMFPFLSVSLPSLLTFCASLSVSLSLSVNLSVTLPVLVLRSLFLSLSFSQETKIDCVRVATKGRPGLQSSCVQLDYMFLNVWKILFSCLQKSVISHSPHVLLKLTDACIWQFNTYASVLEYLTFINITDYNNAKLNGMLTLLP